MPFGQPHCPTFKFTQIYWIFGVTGRIWEVFFLKIPSFQWGLNKIFMFLSHHINNLFPATAMGCSCCSTTVASSVQTYTWPSSEAEATNLPSAENLWKTVVVWTASMVWMAFFISVLNVTSIYKRIVDTCWYISILKRSTLWYNLLVSQEMQVENGRKPTTYGKGWYPVTLIFNALDICRLWNLRTVEALQ